MSDQPDVTTGDVVLTPEEPPLDDGAGDREPLPPSERAQARRERLRLLLKRPGFLVGSIILVFWIACAAFGKAIAPFDPINDFNIPLARPGASHLFGTDQLGRDVLSRVIVGARDVLIAAPVAAVLSVVFGTLLGLIMGYYRGWIDEVLSRIIEAFLSIPVILVALVVIAALGSSTPVVIGTVATLFTPVVTRTVRAAVLSEAQLDYVTSARLRGESDWFIMLREIFPNITGSVIVELTVRIGYAVFSIATLTFLGAGIQPPSPDWGLQISDTYSLIQAGQWWPTIFPALAIASLVIGANLVADSIEAVNAS